MESLRERLCERAYLKGIGLSSEEHKRILTDLKRWLSHNYPTGVLRTGDGSYTLVSDRYGEPYHSLTAGALTEAIEKFLNPSRLKELASSEKQVSILDVGFGLGYNTAVAVHELRRINGRIGIEVLALDMDFPETISLLPEPYRRTQREILGLLPEGEKGGISVRFIKDDMRKTLKKVKNFKADAVFHDPFSPYKNPEAWSLELLCLVRDLMRERGVWVSYTSSLPVRKALLELGFRVGETPPVGRRRGGTVASPRGCVEELSEREKLRLKNSPYSIPFRDPGLELEPLDILIDYRLSVLLRERAVSSRAERELPQAQPSAG